MANLMEPDAPTATKPEDECPMWVVCADCGGAVPAFHEDASTAVHGITVWADCDLCGVTGLSATHSLSESEIEILNRLEQRVRVCGWRIDGLMSRYDDLAADLDRRTALLSEANAAALEAVKTGDAAKVTAAAAVVKMWCDDVADAHEGLEAVVEALRAARVSEDDARGMLKGVAWAMREA